MSDHPHRLVHDCEQPYLEDLWEGEGKGLEDNTEELDDHPVGVATGEALGVEEDDEEIRLVEMDNWSDDQLY